MQAIDSGKENGASQSSVHLIQKVHNNEVQLQKHFSRNCTIGLIICF
jgi:hypothetical protein